MPPRVHPISNLETNSTLWSSFHFRRTVGFVVRGGSIGCPTVMAGLARHPLGSHQWPRKARWIDG